MALSYDEAVEQVTGPGQIFELVEEAVDGVTQRVFKNAPPNLGAVFANARGKEETFLVYEDERWSFDTVMQHVDALGAALVNTYGITKGDRVGIAMRNLPEWIISFAAILSVGGVSVSLNAWWTEEELDYAIGDSGLSLLIADPERVERAHRPAVKHDCPIRHARAHGDQRPALRGGDHPRRAASRRRGRSER